MVEPPAVRNTPSTSSGGHGDTPDRRRFLTSTAVGAATFSLSGCLGTIDTIAGGGDGTDPITIGLLAPQPKSNYIGRSMERAARLAVDELNDDGGLLDREVELVVGDTNGNPLEARRRYHELVLEAGADVTMGVFDSLALRTIMDDIAEQETLHLTSGAATTAASRLVRQDYDRYKYHFRVGPTNDYHLGRAQIDFLDDMAAEIGWESIALFAEDYEWTERPWAVYQNQLEGTGVEVATEERYPAATEDFSSLYARAGAADADAVLITTAHTGNEALGWWANGSYPFGFGGIHVPMQLPTYYDDTNGDCRYAFGQISATANSEFVGGTQEFVTAYQDEYRGSKPVYTGYHTYDAVDLFATVVEAEGTLDTEQLIPALEDVEYDGVAGAVSFYGQESDYPHDLVYVHGEALYYQWQETDAGEGVQEVIWPPDRTTSNANGEYVAPDWL